MDEWLEVNFKLKKRKLMNRTYASCHHKCAIQQYFNVALRNRRCVSLLSNVAALLKSCACGSASSR